MAENRKPFGGKQRSFQILGSWKCEALFLLTFLGGGVAGIGLSHWWPKTVDTTSVPNEFTVIGEVYILSVNGEVQYAPGAGVYFFNTHSPTGEKASDAVVAFEKALEGKIDSPKRLFQSLDTRLRKLNAESRLSERSMDRAFSATCSSRGKFTLKLPLGIYWAVATGRAGFNEAIWFQLVFVSENKTVTLDRPTATYFDESTGER